MAEGDIDRGAYPDLDHPDFGVGADGGYKGDPPSIGRLRRLHVFDGELGEGILVRAVGIHKVEGDPGKQVKRYRKRMELAGEEAAEEPAD